MEHDGPVSGEFLVPVRRTVVILETGETLERKTVHCPLGGLRPIELCTACKLAIALDDSGEHEVLRCHARQPLSAEVTVDEALGADSWCLDPEVPVSEAIALLERRALTSAPVVDDSGILIGIVRLTTLRELDAETRELLQRHPTADEAVADEALEPALAVLAPDEPLANAAAKMGLHEVSELPVVDQADRLVGVLTSGDLLAFLARRGAT